MQSPSPAGTPRPPAAPVHRSRVRRAPPASRMARLPRRPQRSAPWRKWWCARCRHEARCLDHHGPTPAKGDRPGAAQALNRRDASSSRYQRPRQSARYPRGLGRRIDLGLAHLRSPQPYRFAGLRSQSVQYSGSRKRLHSVRNSCSETPQSGIGPVLGVPPKRMTMARRATGKGCCNTFEGSDDIGLSPQWAGSPATNTTGRACRLFFCC